MQITDVITKLQQILEDEGNLYVCYYNGWAYEPLYVRVGDTLLRDGNTKRILLMESERDDGYENKLTNE